MTKGFSSEWDNCYKDNTHLSIWPWSDVVSLVHRYCKPLTESKNVLEFGCGAGANIPLFRSFGMNYFAIEGSQTIVHRLHQRFPDLANQIKVGDFTIDRPFDVEFDLVIDRAALTHNSTSSIRDGLKNALNALNSGGIFIASDWFSTKHSDFLGGEAADDFYTRKNYVEGQFSGVGLVHFFDEEHLSELFCDFNIKYLEEKIAKQYQPKVDHTFSSWNIVACKK